MFIHKNKAIGGYKFKEKTFYSNEHLGVDWRSNYDELYAPCDGEVIATPWGEQGGQWLHFKEEGTRTCEYFATKVLIHRFAHLSELKIKSGKVKEGDIIAISGNTGSLTTAPHTHHDISKEKIDWHDIDNFVDPETWFAVDAEKQKTSEWAKDDVEWCKATGIMEDDTRPQDSVTREEQAVINRRQLNCFAEVLLDSDAISQSVYNNIYARL